MSVSGLLSVQRGGQHLMRSMTVSSMRDVRAPRALPASRSPFVGWVDGRRHPSAIGRVREARLPFVCVYRGNGPTDAYLVRDWLERNGVEVQLRGDRQTPLGAGAVHSAWPTVWVPQDQSEQATAAMARFGPPQLVHPRWVCAGCEEENPANFGSCWQCDADRVVPE